MYVRPSDLLATFEPDGRVMLKSVSRGLGARVPPVVVGILAMCSQPRTADEVGRAMGPQGRALFEQLVQAGWLVSPGDADDTPTMFHNFAGIEVQRHMLADEGRLLAYGAAIRATVRPGDVVIDAGSGSGVLAVKAALAGARRVYAIERSDFAEMIPAIAAASGVGDRVTVVRGDFAQVVLPEKARVLVTETFGAWAFAEDPNPDVAACAARHLEPDGVVIPGRVVLKAAGLAEAPDALLGPFRKRASGVDLTPLRADARRRGTGLRVAPEAVGPPCVVAEVPFPTTGPIAGTVTLDAPCRALCCWFDLALAPGVDLPTGPADAPTHWKQTVVAVDLPAGTHPVRLTPAPEDRRTLLVDIGGTSVRLR